MENLNRAKMLFAVLIYTTKKGLYFSDVDRIFINQERGQLMANETAKDNDESPPFPNEFKHPVGLNAKINFIVNKINEDKIIRNEILDQIDEVLK
jgi:hypothetical protein